ncbi:adenosine monophosphate-protein transferase [Thermoplasma sp. Kam2015]|uniref:adenosine-specific kinase n=1 Tax=Thermoplasma sp. Kam2015 TaxID=2094122 RepID=UPI000D99CEE1|nr:adenosine-specific kinase [Thermoplasma sp. Kam2015]PYB67791.1 adenosine monophosphate-protein transferase [Thermoplasma sp. Kam2015]
MTVSIEAVDMVIPPEANIIVGYSHFIKTVEDLNEIVRTHVPGAKYGIAFSEASGDRLIRFDGNDADLVKASIENIQRISAGHTFVILIRNAYPINILNAVKMCQEVGTVFAATANPLQVILYRGKNGNGVLGVIDGYSPVGVESDEDKMKRREFLRKIGYKE